MYNFLWTGTALILSNCLERFQNLRNFGILLAIIENLRFLSHGSTCSHTRMNFEMTWFSKLNNKILASHKQFVSGIIELLLMVAAHCLSKSWKNWYFPKHGLWVDRFLGAVELSLCTCCLNFYFIKSVTHF